MPASREALGRRSERPLRVGESLRHALARLLGKGALRDPALEGASITVSEVKVSADLSNAVAYVMPLLGEKADERIAALRRAAPYLKGLLGRELRLRRLPDLGFALDPSFAEAERMRALLARPSVARDLDSPAGGAKAGSGNEAAGKELP